MELQVNIIYLYVHIIAQILDAASFDNDVEYLYIVQGVISHTYQVATLLAWGSNANQNFYFTVLSSNSTEIKFVFYIFRVNKINTSSVLRLR